MNVLFSLLMFLNVASNIAGADAPLKDLVKDAATIPDVRDLGSKKLENLEGTDRERLRVVFPKKPAKNIFAVQTPVNCQVNLSKDPTLAVAYLITHRPPAKSFSIGSIGTVSCEGSNLTLFNIATALKATMVFQATVSNKQLGHGSPGNSQMGSGPGATAP